VPVLAVYLCPSSVRVVDTFTGTVNKELTKKIKVYLVFEILIGLRLVKYLSLHVIGELLSVFTQKASV
jgi:hypothetical protein